MPLDTWEAEMRETAQRVKQETGKDVMYVLGRIPVRRNDGSVAQVRGVHMDGGGIIIQADNRKLSVGQIADHETYHDLAARDPALNETAVQRLTERYGPEEIDRALDRYIESMDGLIDLPENATLEQVDAFYQAVHEELLADAYAGIDAYGARASQFSQTVNQVAGERENLRSAQNAAATDRTTGPPESEKYSIEALPDGEQITVIDQGQDAFNGQPKSRYPAIARKILLDKFRGQTLPLSRNDLARFKAEQAGEYAYPRVRYDENSPEFEAKMRAAAELDHLLETAEYSHWARDTKNHKEATLGFDYYTVKFIAGGRLFEGLANIANSENGRILYDITKVKEIPDTSGKYAALMARSSSAFGDLSENSISQVDQKSNDKFSLDDDVELYAEVSYDEEADKGFSDEYAQYQETRPTRRRRKPVKDVEEIPQSSAEYARMQREQQRGIPTAPQSETFSEAVARQWAGGTPQNVPHPEAAVDVRLEELSLPAPENSLLKIFKFKSMGKYMRENGFLDFESAKKDYIKFLQNVPEKNKMLLEQALDAVECEKDTRYNLVFGYDGSKGNDKFLYNPSHKDFAYYDLIIVFTHELAHRIDRFWAHSANNEEFSKAIAEAAQIFYSDTKKFIQYSYDADEDGFISDIFSAICGGKEKFSANHPSGYWVKPGNKEREIFVNLFSLETFGDIQKWTFLEETFPELIRAYLNIKFVL